jgi:OTU domain-containing protein 6
VFKHSAKHSTDKSSKIYIATPLHPHAESAISKSQSLPTSAQFTAMADTQEPESLETLQARHRKEQRDLVSRITQKKKQASKKSRKGVNDECERLERELKERQDHELRALNGEEDDLEHEVEDDNEDHDIEEPVAKLSLDTTTPSSKESSVNGSTPDSAPDVRKKKPNRAKERLARRAASQAAIVAEAELEAATAPNPRALERERMATQLSLHKLALHEIRADGHCLYAAVADQLKTRALDLAPKIPITVAGEGKDGQAYKEVRCAAADWIQAHSEDFAGFMEDPLPEHVRKIRETGEWGGHLELLALARTYGVRICVLHSDGRVDKIQPEDQAGELEEIWLGYYKHSHGLGEHYNSLRKAG